jgi:hypothetical protein
MINVAICLSGAMSKLGDRFLSPTAIYENKPYVNFNICFNSIQKHIIEANPNYIFDFFIHSWNEDLETELKNIYGPKKSLFENQSIYYDEILKKIKSSDDFGGIAKSFSIKKSIILLEEYEIEKDINYDIVMVYRPDILLLKDINFNSLNFQNIYVNSFMDSQGDFHFIMNNDNAKQFKNLYNSIELGNYHQTHWWIKNYVNQFMKQNLVEDDIVAGKDEEVLRKILLGINKTIDISEISKYE